MSSDCYPLLQTIINVVDASGRMPSDRLPQASGAEVDTWGRPGLIRLTPSGSTRAERRS